MPTAPRRQGKACVTLSMLRREEQIDFKDCATPRKDFFVVVGVSQIQRRNHPLFAGRSTHL
jgi:hypothetical protein